MLEKISRKLINFCLDLPRDKREKQITNIKSETENITINSADIKRVRKEYYKKTSGKKTDNLDEMRKFLEKHKLPKTA